MSNKSFLKILVAFGLLALLLVFLGVNYVPRMFASSSAKENTLNTASYAGSDWIERHPAVDTSTNAFDDSNSLRNRHRR
jgi:hypothetical protein